MMIAQMKDKAHGERDGMNGYVQVSAIEVM